MREGKVDLTLLRKEQLEELAVLKKYGLRAPTSDLAIVLGLEAYSDLYAYGGYQLCDRVGQYVLKSGFSKKETVRGYTSRFHYAVDKDVEYHHIDIVNKNGKLHSKHDYLTYDLVGLRPIIEITDKEQFILLNNGIYDDNLDEEKEIIYGELPLIVAKEDLQKKLFLEKRRNTLLKTGKKYDFNGIIVEEVYYFGKKYVLITASSKISEFTLSDGKTYHGGQEIWLEVTPVTWLVNLKNSNIAVAKQILGCSTVLRKNQDKYLESEYTDSALYVSLEHMERNLIPSKVDFLTENEFSKTDMKFLKKHQKIITELRNILLAMKKEQNKLSIHELEKIMIDIITSNYAQIKNSAFIETVIHNEIISLFDDYIYNEPINLTKPYEREMRYSFIDAI
jgi:hypothetical protein